MLAEQFTAAATNARTYRQIDEIARLIWRAHAEGVLSDGAAQAAAEAAQARREAIRGGRPREGLTPTTARRRPVSPDKAASIARRRRLAMSGAIPGPIAAAFTLCELSALTIVAREIQRRGVCDLHIDAIAAKAGTCRTTVQTALRTARTMGLVTVKERRRAGQRSLTNVVEIIAEHWRAWLRLGGVGSKKQTPRIQLDINSRSLSVHALSGRRRKGKDAFSCRTSKTPPPP